MYTLDSADLIAKLRAEHAKGNKHAGLDLYNGNSFKNNAF